MSTFSIHTLLNKFFFKKFLKFISFISRFDSIIYSNSSPTCTSNHSSFWINYFAVISRNFISRSYTILSLFYINNSRRTIPSNISNFVHAISGTTILVRFTSSLSFFCTFKEITSIIIILKISFKHIIIVHVHNSTIEQETINRLFSMRNFLFFKSFDIIGYFIARIFKKSSSPFTNHSFNISSLCSRKIKSNFISINYKKTIISIKIIFIKLKFTTSSFSK